MAPGGIVPSLDELEYGYASLGLGLEIAPVDPLAFERGEETLAHLHTHRRQIPLMV